MVRTIYEVVTVKPWEQNKDFVAVLCSVVPGYPGQLVTFLARTHADVRVGERFEHTDYLTRVER